MAKTQSYREYIKRAYKQIKLELNKNTDADILDFLETVPNKQGLIKKLLREEMARKNFKKY